MERNQHDLYPDLLAVQRHVLRRLHDPRLGGVRLFALFHQLGVPYRVLAAVCGRHLRTIADWGIGRNGPPLDLEGRLHALLAWTLAFVVAALDAASLPAGDPRHARILSLVSEGDGLIRRALHDPLLRQHVEDEWKRLAAALATTSEGQAFVREASDRIERLRQGRGH